MKTLNLFFIIAIILLVGANAFADVKIKTRNTTAGQTFESTVYIKGKRQRSEQNFGGMKTVTLTQCDLRRDVRLNEQARTYFLSLYAAEGAVTTEKSNQSEIRNPQSQIERGGTITTVITLKDTGERKQIFGYTARRILSTIVTESSPDACSPVKSQMETDGWYIDADFALDCFAGAQYKTTIPSQTGGCRDRQIFKRNGSAKLGYPVYLKTTMRGEAGDGEDFVTVQEVLEISPAALDASLFEIPAGFREVKNQAELFTGGAMTNDAETDDEEEADEEEKPKKSTSNVKTQVKNETNSGVKTASQNSSNLPTTIGAKKSGVVRVGLANVKTGAVGEGMNAGELSAAVKNSLAEYLKGTNVELVQIEAKLPLQIKEEAKQKAVDFVIYAAISHKKGGGGFGKVFGKVASIAADVVPGATGDATANAAIYAGKEAVYTAADAAGNVKSKDELTLEIRLETTDASVLTKQFKTKAKSDGEDIISPLIEQAAQAIVNAATGAGK